MGKYQRYCAAEAQDSAVLITVGITLVQLKELPQGLFFEIKDPIGLVVLYMKNGCRPSRDGEAISSNRRSDSASIDVLLTGLKRRTECVIY